MNMLRRLLVKTGLASVMGLSFSSFIIKKAEAKDAEIPFSTMESDIDYIITHGRVNPIYINDHKGGKSLPVLAPAKTEVELGNVVIKWNVFSLDSVELAQWVRLSIFKPKGNFTDKTILYSPPSHVLDIVRFPEGDDTFPTREHSQIWKEWISLYWEEGEGESAEFEISSGDIIESERDNIVWPGIRKSIRSINPNDFIRLAEGEPLRVSVMGVPQEGEYYLLLLEVKRKGRLRLYWRPIYIKPIIGAGNECFIASATYGSCMEPEVEALRRWRDDSLLKSRGGRIFVRFYYFVSPPLARLIRRSCFLRKMSLYVLSPLVSYMYKRYM